MKRVPYPKVHKTVIVDPQLWEQAMIAVGHNKMSGRIGIFLRTLINSPKGKKLGAKIPAHLVKEEK